MIIFKFQAYFNWVQTKFRIRGTNFYFRGHNEKKKIIYKNFVWARSGGSFEPPGLNVKPPMQQPQPGCSTIPPNRAGEDSNSTHVPHSTSSLSTAHSYLANSSPPQHTDSLACSHYSNSHGHSQSPPSGVGDDEPNGGPTITTTLTFSLSESSSSFSPP